jgi:hypothetical protein
MKDNLIANKTFDFALTIIELYIQLKKENEFIIYNIKTNNPIRNKYWS